ncbi:MAG: putative bifunctional diguanylate cyclase/phosphodiesterase [Thainema sp.]
MKTILMIGATDRLQDRTISFIESANFNILSTPNGHEGVRIAQSSHPDLIVCHLSLPDTDGYRVLVQIRSHIDTALIPVILIAADPNQTRVRQGMELGADDVLIEPFTLSQLLGSIQARLSQRAALNERYAAVMRHAAERLNRLVHYDSLTDLPNHLLFRERFYQALNQIIREEQPVAVLYLSVNRLNQINNLMGYPYGDELLRAVAQRLVDCIGLSDTLARLTGSQFAVVLTEISSRRDVELIIQAILLTLAHPFRIAGQEIFVTASIGGVLYPDHGREISELLRKADAAMYHAKQQKGNHYKLFTSDLELLPDDQLRLETYLQYALRRNEFEIYYQPQVNPMTGKLAGAEALIRWFHPEHGPISPQAFIPLAEETGLIVPIGEWVLNTACRQAQRWQTELSDQPLHLSVNISGYQFSQPDLVGMIVHALQHSGLNPQHLELELTETTLVQDTDITATVLHELKQLGIKVAIDDFGTGYSSLNYLKLFPIDTLKLDNCFVRNVVDDPKNEAITRAVIHMAHQLYLEVVAEGVETEAEFDFLRSQQCDLVQGYYTGRPLSSDDFAALVQAS